MTFARQELKHYDTSKVCRLIGVSKSGYYSHKLPNESERSELEKAVIHCFEKNKCNYGRIRLKKALEAEGYRVSESKIARILKENGLKAKDGRPGTKRYTDSKPTEAQYTEENLIKDKFSINTANYLWCSDITELKYRNGKLYVCGVLDVATRRIVGWSIDRNQRKELVHRAFEMAVGRNPIRPTEAVFHSDRGCQYTAVSTKELVEKYGFRKSMSRPGSPHDNQPIESFWHTLSVELPDIRSMDFKSACRCIVRYIELYYNSVRFHSGIGYQVPNDFFANLTL